MPDTMVKKKKPARAGKPLHVWLAPALRDAIEEASERNRRTLTEEVSIALEHYLQAEGLWPPPSGEPAEDD